MIDVFLPPGHVWLRLTRPHYRDPFDTSYARRQGGRWNPPDSWPTLYVNEDMATVHAQVAHMFTGRGIRPDDLDDDAPIMLAAATLPRSQRVADITGDRGAVAAGLPPTYPLDASGTAVPHTTTQVVGSEVHDRGLRGVWCRSASGIGRELAWFPARGARARPHWPAPLGFGRWRHARTLDGIGLPGPR